MKPSQDADKPSAGWLVQVAKSRGIPVDESLIKQALAANNESRPPDGVNWSAVRGSISRVQQGLEAPHELEFLALACRCSTQTVHSRLREHCPQSRYRPEALIVAALGERCQEVSRALNQLFGKDTAEARNAAASLVAMSEPPMSDMEQARPKPVVTQTGATKPRPPSLSISAKAEPGQHGYKVYARTAALCIEVDRLQRPNPAWIANTVLLEAATALTDRPGGGYDWENKIRFQLAQHELPVFAAVMMGELGDCKFTGHGRDHTKSCDVSHQANGISVRIAEGKAKTRRTILVPVSDADRFWVLAVVLQALRANLPTFSEAGLLEMIKVSTRSLAPRT